MRIVVSRTDVRANSDRVFIMNSRVIAGLLVLPLNPMDVSSSHKCICISPRVDGAGGILEFHVLLGLL